MNYGVYSRPPLPRNKYGYVKTASDGTSSSNTFFSSSSSGNGGNAVGGDMSNLADFIGATASVDGQRGIVPAPLAGMQDMFLQGSGAWIDIPAYRWLYEWPKGDGFEKTGLGIDGDFHVGDNLSCLNLQVEGAAHFWELIIDEVKANGGQILVSPSLFECDHLGGTQTYYVDKNHSMYKGTGAVAYPFGDLLENRPDIARIFTKVKYVRARRFYMNCDDGEKRTENECWVGDMMRCRTFNIKAGHYENVSNKDYWGFVVATGEGQYQTENDVHDAFWIDLAYGLRTYTNQYIPLGSENLDFEEGSDDLTFDPPVGWDPYHEVIELKKVSFETLTGSRDVYEEYPDEEEFKYITNQVLLIRGLGGSVDMLTGRISSNSISSMDDLNQTSEMDAYLINGEVPSNPHNLASLVLDGYFSELYDVNLIDSEIEQDTDITYAILGVDEIPDDVPEGEETQYVVKDRTYFTEHDYTTDEYKKWNFGYGLFDPADGDKLACLGHLYNPERMNAIAISSVAPIDPELDPPAIAQYKMIDVFGQSISKFRMTAIAKNGNEFLGSFLIDYNGAYIDVNQRIDLFMVDITTGLETVGIHLDGENSTIKMIGSIELHQHADGDDDTLSVWDSNERKKVEIIPRSIPAKSSSSSTLPEISTRYFDSKSEYFTANSNYITKKKHSVLWVFNVTRSYEMSDFPFTVYTKSNLGTIKAGSILDLSQLNIKIKTTPRLNGSTLATDRGTNKQSITKVALKLYRDNTVIWSNTNLNCVVSGLNTDEFTLTFQGTFLDDYYINTTGEYSLEFEVQGKLYAWLEIENNYDNYYYRILTVSTGNYTYALLVNQGGGSSSDGTMMTIGTNGLVFNASNSRYFYAGDDGFELKWDDASVTLDSANGLRLSKLCTTINTGTINKKYDCVLVTGSTVTVPSATEFGSCRELTIICSNGLIVNFPNNSLRLYIGNTWNNYSQLGVGGQSGITPYVTTGGCFKLTSAFGNWYLGLQL